MSNYFKVKNYLTKGSLAAFKVSLIRKVLNRGYNLEFTEGTIYYPDISCSTKDCTYFNKALRSGELEVIAKFIVRDQEYSLLGGSGIASCFDGLGTFYRMVNACLAYTNVAFLGCATREIAQHMSKYFAIEIFEAKYADFVDFEWIE